MTSPGMPSTPMSMVGSKRKMVDDTMPMIHTDDMMERHQSANSLGSGMTSAMTYGNMGAVTPHSYSTTRMNQYPTAPPFVGPTSSPNSSNRSFHYPPMSNGPTNSHISPSMGNPSLYGPNSNMYSSLPSISMPMAPLSHGMSNPNTGYMPNMGEYGGMKKAKIGMAFSPNTHPSI